MHRVRVVDLETTGARPPAHDVCEIGWQDVVQGADGRWAVAEPEDGAGGDGADRDDVGWPDAARGARFVDPGRPIPPVTMAVHHIVDADVAGAGRWREVAPAVLRPAGGVLALAAHRAAFEQRFCTPALSGGARWICTWKCALRLWPGAPGFSNQLLRYWRMPAGLDRARGLPAHRALPDAYVTAHHLRDMLNAASLAQLLAWSELPGLLPRVPAGAERGRAWGALDDATLAGFAADRDEDIRFSAQAERDRRGQGASPPPAPVAAQGRLL